MAQPAPAVNRRQLWLEFAALYLGAPLIIALFMPGRLLFPALGLLMLVGLVILWRSGGFDLRSLVRGWGQVPVAQLLAFGICTALIAGAVMLWLKPEGIRPLTPARLRFLAMVWVLYPILSALPQELIFRPLFFHRYGLLFANARMAVLVNAAVFSFAHLMYWSWLVMGMTFAGGLVFALAYLRHGFPSAWIFHALAGNILFTLGMGAYFYSGNVVRPF